MLATTHTASPVAPRTLSPINKHLLWREAATISKELAGSTYLQWLLSLHPSQLTLLHIHQRLTTANHVKLILLVGGLEDSTCGTVCRIVLFGLYHGQGENIRLFIGGGIFPVLFILLVTIWKGFWASLGLPKNKLVRDSGYWMLSSGVAVLGFLP